MPDTSWSKMASSGAKALAATGKAWAPSAVQRNIIEEALGTLEAQRLTAPGALALEQTYGPAYARLQRQQMLESLLGGEGVPGLLNVWEEQVQPAATRAELAATSAQRTADMADLAKMGPEAMMIYRRAWEAANPEQARLTKMLSGEAERDLALGTRLDPATLRELQQASRAAQTARGGGYSPVDAFSEVMTTGQAGQQMQAQRRAFATQAAGVNASIPTADPFMAILGRPVASPSLAGQGISFGASSAQSGQRMFDPFNSYAADLYNTNLNASTAKQIAAGNRSAGIFGGLLNIGGSLLKGALFGG